MAQGCLAVRRARDGPCAQRPSVLTGRSLSISNINRCATYQPGVLAGCCLQCNARRTLFVPRPCSYGHAPGVVIGTGAISAQKLHNSTVTERQCALCHAPCTPAADAPPAMPAPCHTAMRAQKSNNNNNNNSKVRLGLPAAETHGGSGRGRRGTFGPRGCGRGAPGNGMAAAPSERTARFR